MIQRIQSLYLIGVMALSVALYFVNFSFVFPQDDIYKITFLNVCCISANDVAAYKPASYPALMVLNSLVLLFTLYTLFKFKVRLHQIKLVRLIMFLTLLLLGGMFLYTDVVKSKISNAHVTYWYGVIFPIIQAILLFMATGAIKKDENIVRSADRLR